MDAHRPRVETPIGEMWLDDGVLVHRLRSTTVTLEDAAEVRRLVTELTGGIPMPAVVDMRSIAFAPRKVRQMFAASPDDALELATALVVSSSSSETMARVFTSIDKPARPIRIFTSESDAFEWARERRRAT